MAEKMTLEQLKLWARNQVILDDVTEREQKAAIAAIDALSQPAQAMDVGLVERLRKRAAEERQIAENNARVAELLAPELARFKAGEEHNVYATRMAIDHRDSAKRDAAFADDLEMVASALAGEKAGWREGWTASRDDELRLWYVHSPSGDIAGVYDQAAGVHAEVLRQLAQSLPASPTPDKEGA